MPRYCVGAYCVSRIGWYDVTTYQESPMEEFIQKKVRLPDALGKKLGGIL